MDNRNRLKKVFHRLGDSNEAEAQNALRVFRLMMLRTAMDMVTLQPTVASSPTSNDLTGFFRDLGVADEEEAVAALRILRHKLRQARLRTVDLNIVFANETEDGYAVHLLSELTTLRGQLRILERIVQNSTVDKIRVTDERDRAIVQRDNLAAQIRDLKRAFKKQREVAKMTNNPLLEDDPKHGADSQPEPDTSKPEKEEVVESPDSAEDEASVADDESPVAADNPEDQPAPAQPTQVHETTDFVWKDVRLPDKTAVRLRYKKEEHFAIIEGGAIQYQNTAMTPWQFMRTIKLPYHKGEPKLRVGNPMEELFVKRQDDITWHRVSTLRQNPKPDAKPKKPRKTKKVATEES